MKAMDLLKALGNVKDSYVISAEEFRQGRHRNNKRFSAKKAVLVAAIIALTLLLVGCAVVYVLSLRDMKIGENTITKKEHYGPNWEVIEETQITYDVLSVQSFTDSPNQQATREWQVYRDSFETYDPLKIPDEVRLSVPDHYAQYGCWCPEMMEELDVLAKKYGLKLMEGERLGTNQEHVTVLLDAFDLPELLRPQPYAEVIITSAGIYRHGSYHLGLNIILEESFDWPYYIMADLHYSTKGYFDDYTITVRNLETVQEWEYPLPNGSTALLALDEETAVILVEGKEGFFAMDFDAKMGIDRVTPEMMERIADLFDFSMIPRKLTDAEWEEATLDFLAAEEQHRLDYNAWVEKYSALEKKDSYDEWVRQALENYRETASLGYAFYDIEGNGKEELLIGRDGYCEAIFWEQDGIIQQFANAAVNLYVCEDGKIAYVLMTGEEYFHFTQLENGTSRGLGAVQHTPGNPEGEYRIFAPDSWGDYVYAPKEEYDAMLYSFKRIPISFVPLTEYPLTEPVTESQEKHVYNSTYTSYEEMIRMYLTNQEERWSRWAYHFVDLDGDGQEEMIWREDSRYFIYTIADGKLVCYSMISDGTITVCEDGIVQATIHYGPDNFTTRFYRLNRGKTELVDYLRYDVDVAPENPWFRSPDLTGQDMTLKPISEMEAKSIIASYDPLEMDMKPIAEYPFQ